MSSQIEIIPTRLLDIDILHRQLDGEKSFSIIDLAEPRVVESDDELPGDIFKIVFHTKNFILQHIDSRDDFLVYPPLDYLDEKHSNTIDIESLATGWEKVGGSYFIEPEGEYDDIDFVQLVAMIAKVTNGAILNINAIWPWSIGLSTPEELIAKFMDYRKQD